MRTAVIESELQFALVGSIKGEEKIIAKSKGCSSMLQGVANQYYSVGYDAGTSELDEFCSKFSINKVWSKEFRFGNNEKYVKLLFCWQADHFIDEQKNKSGIYFDIQYDFNDFIRDSKGTLLMQIKQPIDSKVKDMLSGLQFSNPLSSEYQFNEYQDRITWYISPLIFTCLKLTSQSTLSNLFGNKNKVTTTQLIYHQLNLFEVNSNRYRIRHYDDGRQLRNVSFGMSGIIQMIDSAQGNEEFITRMVNTNTKNLIRITQLFLDMIDTILRWIEKNNSHQKNRIDFLQLLLGSLKDSINCFARLYKSPGLSNELKDLVSMALSVTDEIRQEISRPFSK